MMAFAQNSSIKKCTRPPLLKSHNALQTGYWRTVASFAMPFSSLVRMCTKNLATKCNYYSGRQGEALSSIFDSVFEQTRN